MSTSLAPVLRGDLFSSASPRSRLVQAQGCQRWRVVCSALRVGVRKHIDPQTQATASSLELVIDGARLGPAGANSSACFSTGSCTWVRRTGLCRKPPPHTHQKPNNHKQVGVPRNSRTVQQRKSNTTHQAGRPCWRPRHSPTFRWLMTTKVSSSGMLRVCSRVAGALLRILSLQDLGGPSSYQLEDHQPTRGGSCRALLAATGAGTCNTACEHEGEPQGLVTG